MAAVAAAKANPDAYVIKPQREGGGNNLYGADVKHALETMTDTELAGHIMMQRIFPKKRAAVLVRAGTAVSGGTVSELGMVSRSLSSWLCLEVFFIQ